jgi:pilus assembly protein CpaE
MEILFYSTAKSKKNIKEMASALAPNNIFSLNSDISNLIDAVYKYDPDILFISEYFDLENTIETLKNIFIIKPQIEIVFCIKKPDPSFIIKLMRIGIREVVDSFDLADIKPVIDRIQIRNQDLLKSNNQRQSKILAFMSAKGGDGATCVAANIAATISQDN